MQAVLYSPQLHHVVRKMKAKKESTYIAKLSNEETVALTKVLNSKQKGKPEIKEYWW
ncbi:MAG TPA: hypothetical protein VF260_09320 [Bacilli bacterium]